MRYAVVGAGECGNRVADHLTDRLPAPSLLGKLRSGPSTTQYLAINTSAKDLEEIDQLKRDQVLKLDGPPGTGANRVLGREAFEDARATIQDRVGSFEGVDALIVIGAAGGGTGGALLPGLVEMLRSMRPSTPIFAVVVLPFSHESEIYHSNTAECLRELEEADPTTILLVSNDRLRTSETSLSKAYPSMNATLADRLGALFNALGSEMEVSADLGDVLTVLGAGSGYSTLSYAEGTRHQPLTEVLQTAFQPERALFDVDLRHDAKRAILLIEAAEDQLDMDEVLGAIAEVAGSIGDVFRGIRVTRDPPRILGLYSLGRPKTLERVLAAKPAEPREGSDDLTTQLDDVDDYQLD